MQDFKKFIVPAYDNEGSPCGTGFIIPGYFITAGHLFDNSDNITIFFNTQHYSFGNADATYLKTPKEGSDEEAQDIAIFNFDNSDSPLKLCGLMPYVNSPFDCYSLIPINEQPNMLITTECQVTRTLFNFFECDTNVRLKQGYSGSPLIYNNTVYGILSGCLDEINQPDKILFCSTKNLPIL